MVKVRILDILIALGTGKAVIVFDNRESKTIDTKNITNNMIQQVMNTCDQS